jgi:hypothetical protein
MTLMTFQTDTYPRMQNFTPLTYPLTRPPLYCVAPLTFNLWLPNIYDSLNNAHIWIYIMCYVS